MIAAGALLAVTLVTLAATVFVSPPGWLVAPPTGGKFTQKSGITARGRAFRLVVRRGPLDRLRREYRRATVSRGWGAGDAPFRKDNHFILGISLSIDGRSVTVPPGAFMDLFAWRPGEIEETGDDFCFRFEGSDAMESYEGFFVIHDLGVVRRQIWPGEFPEWGPEVKRFGS